MIPTAILFGSTPMSFRCRSILLTCLYPRKATLVLWSPACRLYISCIWRCHVYRRLSCRWIWTIAEDRHPRNDARYPLQHQRHKQTDLVWNIYKESTNKRECLIKSQQVNVLSLENLLFDSARSLESVHKAFLFLAISPHSRQSLLIASTISCARV